MICFPFIYFNHIHRSIHTSKNNCPMFQCGHPSPSQEFKWPSKGPLSTGFGNSLSFNPQGKRRKKNKEEEEPKITEKQCHKSLILLYTIDTYTYKNNIHQMIINNGCFVSKRQCLRFLSFPCHPDMQCQYSLYKSVFNHNVSLPIVQ